MAKEKKSMTVGKKGKKQGAMPTKTTMNLAFHESNFHPQKVLPLVLVIVIAAALFVKFGFLDQLSKKTAAYNALSEQQTQLELVNLKLAGYDELADRYGRYSFGWMTEEEAGLVERGDVFTVLESKLISSSIVKDIAVNKNVVTANICGVTLDQARAIVKALEEDPLVSSATIYSAKTEEATMEADVFMTIILEKEVKEAE